MGTFHRYMCVCVCLCVCVPVICVYVSLCCVCVSMCLCLYQYMCGNFLPLPLYAATIHDQTMVQCFVAGGFFHCYIMLAGHSTVLQTLRKSHSFSSNWKHENDISDIKFVYCVPGYFYHILKGMTHTTIGNRHTLFFLYKKLEYPHSLESFLVFAHFLA